MIGFIDTWGWLEPADRRGPRHRAVKRAYRRWRRDGWRVVTTDYVLDETMTFLFMRRPFLKAKQFMESVFESAESGHLGIEPVTPARFREAWHLRLRYDDQPRISFTDLTSFAVMRDLGATHAMTQDAHFGIAGFARAP